MKIDFLGAYGGNTDVNNLTSFLVDDCLALDAGCLTHTLTLEKQLGIDNLLISHSHLDHTLTLPFLADNIYGSRDTPLYVWTSDIVQQGLKQHIFNEVIWPDFSKLPSEDKPTITFNILKHEVPVEMAHFKVTAIPVNHLVPSTGFLVESMKTNDAFIYTSDTCNTDRIWEVANQTDNLKAVIVDCSFPNEMEELAIMSGHMTPALLGADLVKLKKDCKVLIYHIKPGCGDIMARELDALGDDRLIYNIQGMSITL